MNLLEEIKTVQNQAELLYDQQQIHAALDQMAEKINALLFDRNPIFLCVLNGGIITAGELLTRLHFPLTVDSISASRYGQNTTGADVQWLFKPITTLKNRTILIIDDILDQGLTLLAIKNWCFEQGADSIFSAVLVNKTLPEPKPVVANFVGLNVADRYVFGYGMDYKGYLRNLPGIYACKN